MPSSFLLDENGFVAAIYRGAHSVEEVLADVELLSKSPEEQRSAAVPFDGRWASSIFPSDPIAVVKTLENSGHVESRSFTRGISYLQRYVAMYRSADQSSLVRTHRQLASRLLAAERYEELRTSLQTLQELAPNSSQLHRDLGTQLLQAGRATEALSHFELAIVQLPDDATLYYNAGLAALSTKQFERAVDHLGCSTQLAPNDPATHLHLGNAFLFSGERKSAIQQFLTALELKPNWSLPANNVAWLLSTVDDEALRDGQQALRIIEPFCRDWETNSVAPSILGTYVATLAETGDFELAKQVNRKLIASAESEEKKRRLVARQRQLEDEKPIRDPIK